MTKPAQSKQKKNKKRNDSSTLHPPSPKQIFSIWFYLIPPFILAALTTVFYSPSLNYAFQFDSVANITKHFSIRHHGFKDLFLKNTRWISYWLNSLHYGIGKFNPFSYRVGNLIIHIANGLLVFFILFLALKQLKKRNFFSRNAFSISFFTAILFLLHPVQTQTVSYVIQGQLEGLAALFILSMILCFFMFTRAQSTLIKTIIVILLFTLGLFSCGTKEIAIISPALLVLFDWFFISQGSWSSFKKRMFLHAALVLFIFGIYLYFLKPDFFTSIIGLKKVAKNNIGNVITHKPGLKITPWMFFRSQFKVILHYLWMFIWPFNISVEYDWMLSRGILHPDAFFPLAILSALAFTIFRLLRRNITHLIGFGALWFFICISPRSSIIPSPELLVDYKTYLASAGWLFLLASGIVWLILFVLKKIKSLPRFLHAKHQGAHVAGIAFALLLGFLTIQRNTVWRSGTEFWGNVIKNAPGKARAYNNYGVELSQNKKDYKGSIPYFKKAISMDKNYADPLNNLSVAYSHLGKLDDAIETLKKSLKINPYYPEGYNNLASFYIQKGELEKAERSLSLALRMRPHYGKALFNLGRVALKRGNKEKAWEYFRDCCTKADFDVKFGFSIYAQVSMELKKYTDAVFAYGKMLQIDPRDLKTAFNYANACFLSKDYVKAQGMYEQLIAQNPGDIKSWYNLAETYFELKKFKKALEGYRKTYHLRARLPYIQVRMAHCLEITGKPYEAKKMIETFLKEKHRGSKTILAQLRPKAEKLLKEMNKKYPGTKPNIAV